MQSDEASLFHDASLCGVLPKVALGFALSRQWRHLLFVAVGFNLMLADNLESFVGILSEGLRTLIFVELRRRGDPSYTRNSA